MAFYIGEHRYDQRATFWKIVEDKGTYAVVSLGTSKKDKEKNWHNSNWSFCRFVGNAYKGLEELQEKDQIVIVSGLIDREPYVDKDGVKQWPKNEKITIFAWKKYVPESEESSDPPLMESDEEEPNEDNIPF
jgi:single-stranded DNA-binding protein